MSKTYKVSSPIGNTIPPKELMTEKEIREFLPTIIGDAEMAGVWKEKADKDPIEDLVEYLNQAGYVVTEQKNA